MPTDMTKKEETIVAQIVSQLEQILGGIHGVMTKVNHIYPSNRDSESEEARPESVGLAQALVLLKDLRADLNDLHSHLDQIV